MQTKHLNLDVTSSPLMLALVTWADLQFFTCYRHLLIVRPLTHIKTL